MPLWPRYALLLLCTACAPTHHALRSRWVEESRPAPEPAVQLAAKATRPKRLSVVGCGANCEAAVRALEDALFAAHFELVDPRALGEDAACHQRTTLEAAAALGLDHVLFVSSAPSATQVVGHFERNYFASGGEGQVGGRATPSAQDADRFDLLLARVEGRVQSPSSIGDALAVTLVRVTGEQTLRFRGEPVRTSPRMADLTVFVACQNGTCRELSPARESARAPRGESRRVLTGGASTASFTELAKSLVNQLVSLPDAS